MKEKDLNHIFEKVENVKTEIALSLKKSVESMKENDKFDEELLKETLNINVLLGFLKTISDKKSRVKNIDIESLTKEYLTNKEELYNMFLADTVIKGLEEVEKE